MTKQDEYRKQAKAKLKEWQGKIDDLEAKKVK